MWYRCCMNIPDFLHPAGLLLPAGADPAGARGGGAGRVGRVRWGWSRRSGTGRGGGGGDAAPAGVLYGRRGAGVPCGAGRGVLWGTWYVGYDETTVLPRVVRGRFNSARLLLVEQVFDPRSAAFRNGPVRVMREAIRRASPSAVAGLGAATRDELRDAGITEAELGSYSLSGLAVLVPRRAPQEPAGVLPSAGMVDVNLMGFARSIGTPVEGLERLSVAEVQALGPSDPNGADAADLLRLALRQRSGLPGLREWMRGQYGSGRIGALVAALNAWRAAPADLRRVDAGRAALLTRRNLAWMPRLEAALAPGAGESRAVFVAVGAAHMMGTDGLPALLRGRGWGLRLALETGCRRSREWPLKQLAGTCAC